MVKTFIQALQTGLKGNDLYRFAILLTLFCIAVTPAVSAQEAEEDLVYLEGEVENSLDTDYLDGALESETGFSTELEVGEVFNLDTDLTNVYESGGENTWEAEFDLEVVPEFGPEEDLVFYLETDLSDTDPDEALIGIEGTVLGTDYDLGINIGEDDNEIYLDLYRWFDSGVSLRSGISLGDGPTFRVGDLRFRGVPVRLGGEEWELSGELEGTLEKSGFGPDDRVKLSFDLENEKVDFFRFPKRGGGVSFYKLVPLNSDQYSVVLHNSEADPIDIEGWSISNGSEGHEISDKKIIEVGGKLEIEVPGPIVDDGEKLVLLSPKGKTEDTWPLPRFYFGNEELYRREGVLERQILLSFEDNDFDELRAEWGLEVPSGPESLYFGDFALNHLSEIKKAALGYDGSRTRLKFSLLNEEVEMVFRPVRNEFFDSEVSLELNGEGELKTVFELDQEFEGFELGHAVEYSDDTEETEIKLEQVLEWDQLEVELAYEFVDSSLAEFEIVTAYVF